MNLYFSYLESAKKFRVKLSQVEYARFKRFNKLQPLWHIFSYGNFNDIVFLLILNKNEYF